MKSAAMWYSLSILVLVLVAVSGVFVGGMGPLKPADEEVMRITRTVYPEITKSLGVSGHITPVSYKKQLVAGLNYFVKVKLNDSEYAHLRIFVPLGTTVHNLLDPQHTPSLVAIEDDHTRDDDITYFSATSLKSHAKTQQNV